MDPGPDPPNFNAGFVRWEAGKPVRKTAQLPQDDENDTSRQYNYVRRDNQPAPQGRKRKSNRDIQGPVIGYMKRHMTSAEVVNRNKLVKKPMKQKLLGREDQDDRRPPEEPIAHSSRNPPPNVPSELPNQPANNNSRPRLPFNHVSCGQRCRKEGCQTIPVEYRRRIFDEFNHMTNDEKYFVMRTLMHIKRDCGVQESGTNNKTKSWKYNLVYLQQNLQVCMNNFLGTLGVSKTQVAGIHERMGDATESVFFRNMTGRHDNRPHKITENVFEHVAEFLASKDRLDNHYSRGRIDGDVKFLDKKYSYASLYKEYDSVNQVAPFKLSVTTFRKIMRCEGYFVGEAYNDTCGTCDRLHVMIEISAGEEKLQYIEDKENHLKEVELAKQARAADIHRAKTEDSYFVLTVDLQQTIFSPNLTCGPAFYCRKFATNNFGIHDEKTGKGYFKIWFETDARKGADEIASAIFTHIQGNFEVLGQGEKRTLVIFSDRCCGQNNNYVMLVFYRKLISMKYFTDIYQKFVISGHSYLSPDRDFGVIEKVLRRISVKVPTELQRAINDAAENFQATKLRQQSFFNFDRLVAYWSRPKDLQVTKCISFYQHDRDFAIHTTKTHDPEEQTIPYYPHHHEDLDSKKLPNISERKYHEPLRLQKSKKEDLMKLMRWLTPAQRKFYLPHILPHPRDDDDDQPRGNDMNMYGRTEEHPYARVESLED